MRSACHGLGAMQRADVSGRPAARSEPARSAAPAVPRARSLGPAAARRATRRCRCGDGRRASSATRRPAAAAGICAATARSCRSTTASSASCSPTSCWPTSTRRWRPAREHITFGDPDFFNGPTHALRIVEALHAAHPALTYDVTIKVEHLLQHRDLLPRLRDTGCLFVTSAVESLDDRVLAILDKGHTRARFRRGGRRCAATPASRWCRRSSRSIRGLTLEGYCDLLDTIDGARSGRSRRADSAGDPAADPEGSRLLEVDEVRRARRRRSIAATLTYRWAHRRSARRRACTRRSTALVGRDLTSDRRGVFDEISALAHERAGLPPRRRRSPARAAVPCRISTSLGTAARSRIPSRLERSGAELRLGTGLLPESCCSRRRPAIRRARSARRPSGSGVDLVFATDRCHVLDDPWRDDAIPDPLSRRGSLGGGHPRAAADGADRRRAGGRRSADGHRGARRSRRSDCRGIRRTARGRGPQQAADARAASARGPAGARGSSTATADRRSRDAARRPSTFPCVVKPLALSGSRGVMRADDRGELVAAFDRLRALLQSPDIRAERNGRARLGARRRLHPRPGVRGRRAA